MSETTFQNILMLLDSVDKHSELVARRMRDAGLQADPALIESVAKYWETLERLADE